MIKVFIIAEWLSLHSREFGINQSIVSEMPKASKIAATNPK
jgi:hypothetical protein